METRHTPNIKAVFFDIDGTLVSFKTHEVPESARQAIRALRAKGIKTFIATGRRKGSINNLGDLEFDGYVTVNGSCCMVGEEIIHEQVIPQADIEALEEYEESVGGFPWAIVRQDHIYINRVDKDVEHVFRLLHLDHPVVCPPQEVPSQGIIQLLVFLPEEQEPLLQKLMPGCETTRWNPLFCDVIPKGSGKQVGIGKMLEYFGIDRSETMAFGDGGNDMEMLRYVEYGIAMGNAEPEVKRIADYVTTSVDNKGILKGLKRYGVL